MIISTNSTFYDATNTRSALTNQAGLAKVKLNITNQFAGDNYQVRAVCVNPEQDVFGNSSATMVPFDLISDPEKVNELFIDTKYSEYSDTYKKLEKKFIKTSAILVAWKRIYLERDNMLQIGATIVSTVSSSDTVISVDNVNDFTDDSTDNKNLITLFKPNYSSSNQAQMSIYNARVIAIDTTNKTLTIDAPSGNLTFKKYSGIKISTKNDIYTISATESGGLLTQAYGNKAQGSDGGAFIEFVSLSDSNGSNNIPKYTKFPNDKDKTSFAFCNFWFKNNGDGTNIFQLVATKKHSDNSNGTARESENISFITIERFNYGSKNPIAIAATTVHELGHQFEVSSLHIDDSSIISNWNNSDKCIMSYSFIRDNGIARFDIDCLDQIREATEKR